MTSHADLLNAMPPLRTALILRYKWFIHETPEGYINKIRANGLLPNRDAPEPPEVREALRSDHVPILCLHPLGAKLCPGGAAATLVLPLGQDAPPRVSFAVDAPDLPQRIGLDWSYEWREQENELRANAHLPPDAFIEIAVQLVDKFGSVAAYDGIAPNKLRVFCNGDPPANPSGWSSLNKVQDKNIVHHR